MNKKTLIGIVILIIVAITYYVINKKPWGINYKDIANFAIEDTAAIDKIFIADRNGKTITLTKQGNGYWIINSNKRADNSKIKLLLYTMKALTVLRPVGENEHNTAVGNLATVGIKAVFYTKDNVVKTIYVGTATQEQNGTYMLIEGSNKTYVTHNPGFFGYLTPRFISDSLVWRDRTIFNYTPEQIKRIELRYSDNTGYIIDNSNVQTPQIFNLNNEARNITDMQFLKYYIGSFKQLNFDGYDENQNQRIIDSLSSQKAYCIVKVTESSGQENTLTLYNKPIDKHTKQLSDEITGELFKVDKERYWAFANNDKSIMLVQQFNFGKVMRKLEDFK